jgi:lysyl-tRNA synthetase class 2
MAAKNQKLNWPPNAENQLKFQKDDEPYAGHIDITHRISEIPRGDKKCTVTTAGRVIQIEAAANNKIKGTISDGTGSAQFIVSKGAFSYLQPGHIVEIHGETQPGTPSIQISAQEIKLVTHSKTGLPDREDWLSTSMEIRRVYPEIELLLNTDIGQRLRLRPRVLRSIRRFLEERDFLEVDTPFLVPWPDISPVTPLMVMRGRYVKQSDLRLANTEFMRRLLVGGFNRIYQLGRCFRDEQTSFKHQIEFTQLTFGIAFAPYEFLMELIEEMVLELIRELKAGERIKFQDKEIDFSTPWTRVTVRDSFYDATGIDLDECPDADMVIGKAKNRGLKLPELEGGYGGMLSQARLLDFLLDEYVVPMFKKPTWLCEYPYYLGGPAKEIPGRPAYKMRSELFVEGIEIANISVPQNDPQKVRTWYEETRRLKCEKGWDTPFLDEPYLSSMELGIPVATTGGLGFDRLLMLLLDTSDIQDVLFFLSGAQYEVQ